MGREALHASHALHPRRGVPIPRRGPRTPGRGWVHGGTRRQCGSSVPRESRGLLCLSGLRADFRCEDAAGLDAPHSFGRKALERFARNTSTHRYWEDRWLKEHGLSRGGLLHEVRDRSQHPLRSFSIRNMKTPPSAAVSVPKQGSTFAASRRCCGRPSRPYAASVPWPRNAEK